MSTSATSMIVRDSSEMPTLGPETLDLLFRLGCLTTSQLRALLCVRRSESSVQRITKRLRGAGMIRSVRRPYRYGRASASPAEPPTAAAATWQAGATGGATGGATEGATTASTRRPGRWVTIHYLTEDGISLVARDRDLYPAVALSLYARVLDDARVYHALLRNEFYAWLVEDLTCARAGARAGARASASSSLEIETLCAESGYTPMRLADGKRGKRRYLNPDGVLELSDAEDPSVYERVMVESDTGSQDMPWQISQKAEKLGEHLLTLAHPRDSQGGTNRSSTPASTPVNAQASAQANGKGPVPAIPWTLFVSPTVTRMRWVREVFREDAVRDGSQLAQARTSFLAATNQRLDVAARITFTNLQWLAEYGTLGDAYWPLTSAERTTLLP